MPLRRPGAPVVDLRGVAQCRASLPIFRLALAAFIPWRGAAVSTGPRDGTRADGVLDRGRRRLFSFSDLPGGAVDATGSIAAGTWRRRPSCGWCVNQACCGHARARGGADSSALGQPTDLLDLLGPAGRRCGCRPTSTFLFSGIVVRRFGGGRWSSADRRRCDVGFACSGRRRWCRPALTMLSILTRAREAGRRDAIFDLLDLLDGPGRCGGSRPRLRR